MNRFLLYAVLGACLYFLSGTASQKLALIEGKNVFAVWMPTGVALSFFLFFSGKFIIFLGIFVGAFAFNYFSAENSFFLASFIGLGNAIGPYITFMLLDKREKSLLSNPYTVFRFIIAILVGAGVTAINGSFLLFVFGIIPFSVVFKVFPTWFTGDAIGFLLLAPFLTESIKKDNYNKTLIWYWLLLLIPIGFVSYLVFMHPLFPGKNYGFQYLPLIILFILVFAYHKAGAVWGTFIISFIAIFGTGMQIGPFFQGSDINTSLILLQMYLAVSAIMSYFLASSLHQLDRAVLEIKAFNIRLKQEVKETVEPIQEKERQLSEKERRESIYSLLMNIAHHWRQPLNVIYLAAQEIKEIIEDNGEYKGQEGNPDIIMKEAESLSKTISFFTNLSKQYNNGIFQEIAVQSLIQSILDKTDKDSINVKINWEILEQKIFHIPKIIERVYQELIRNSIHSALQNQKNQLELNFGAYKENDFVNLTIEDDAGGIKIQPIESIFEPYITSFHKTRDKGLGLYVVKVLVENSQKNGRILVENTKKGAKFQIRIPYE